MGGSILLYFLWLRFLSVIDIFLQQPLLSSVISLARGLGALGSYFFLLFSFYKGDNFLDSIFAFLHTKSTLKGNNLLSNTRETTFLILCLLSCTPSLLLKEIICSQIQGRQLSWYHVCFPAHQVYSERKYFLSNTRETTFVISCLLSNTTSLL